MALDGLTLNLIKKELDKDLLGARVDKVHQPSKDELIITFRGYNGSRKLYISANASIPRIHFINNPPENPAEPTMFCMRLRKLFAKARLTNITQNELERILTFEFRCFNEIGDEKTYYIIVEIMGRHSNIILADENYTVLDAVKRVNGEMSSVRILLPGVKYEAPPAQDKINILNCDLNEVIERIIGGEAKSLNKAVQSVLMGFAPLLCREVSHFVGADDISPCDITDEMKQKLKTYLEFIKATVDSNKPTPTMLIDKSQNKLLDYCFLPINQYGSNVKVQTFTTISELLEAFYKEKTSSERIRQKSHDLLKKLTNISDRASRKILTLNKELEDCEKKDEYRVKGDLLSANIYKIGKGQKEIEVENFYENNAPVKITLDPSKSASDNVQLYYKKYRKAKTAEDILVSQIQNSEAEVEYIDTVFDNLSRAETEKELAEIKEELRTEGYIKSKSTAKRAAKSLPFLKFLSSDGYEISVGRNNIQNDKLTLRSANNNDMWLHVKNMPGSHTVIKNQDGKVSDKAIEEAAVIAAYHSKGKNSSQVPVDYTQIRNVSKPNGAKAGRVIYVSYNTAYVTPNEALVEQLSVK